MRARGRRKRGARNLGVRIAFLINRGQQITCLEKILVEMREKERVRDKKKERKREIHRKIKRTKISKIEQNVLPAAVSQRIGL